MTCKWRCRGPAVPPTHHGSTAPATRGPMDKRPTTGRASERASRAAFECPSVRVLTAALTRAMRPSVSSKHRPSQHALYSVTSHHGPSGRDGSTLLMLMSRLEVASSSSQTTILRPTSSLSYCDIQQGQLFNRLRRRASRPLSLKESCVIS